MPTGLDLPRAGGHGKIGDKRIFSFARAMRNHRRVCVPSRHVDGVQRFTHAANLVYLDENGIGNAFVNAATETLSVGNKKIVAHKLDIVAQFVRHAAASLSSHLPPGRLQ